MLPILAILAVLIVPTIMHNAYAQGTTQTFDMSPLMAVIIAIIPVFIVLTLLDKLLGKVRS